MSEIDQNTPYSYIILCFGEFFRFPEVTKLHFWSDKTEIFIYKVPFTLYSLVELIHKSTYAKEQKIGHVNAFKKEPQSKFCHFRITKKVEDFWFLHQGNPVYCSILMYCMWWFRQALFCFSLFFVTIYRLYAQEKSYTLYDQDRK